MSDGRRAGGALLALVGAAGAAGTAYLDWLDGQSANDMSFSRLFDGDPTALADMTSSWWNSIAVALGVVGVLGVIGAVLRSRLVLWLAFLVGVATAVLFVVFTFQAADAAGMEVGPGDLKIGFWLSVVALVVLAIGIITMGRRGDFTRDEANDTVGDPVGDPEV